MSAVPKLRFSDFKENWKVEKLGKRAVKIGSGVTPSGGSKSYVKSGIPLIRSQNVKQERLVLKDVAFITENTHQSMSNSFVQSQDVLLNITGASIGRSCVVPESLGEANVNQHVCIIRLEEKTAPSFLQTFLSSSRGQKMIFRTQAGGGREGLNFETIKNFNIPFPSLPEQKKIADFLGAVDDKIAGLRERESLLTQYKKGVMQKIFTQTLRFKADDGSDFPDWEMGKVSDIGYFYYGKSAPKHSLSDDAPTPCVRYGELYSTYDEVVGEIQSYTNIPPENLKFSVGGEVLVPRVGEDPLEFANCSYLPHKDIAIGEMISVFNTEHNGLFWTYYFNNKLKRDIARMVEGGSVANLYFRYLEPLKISIPSIPEQQKIADFLSAIDTKITAVSAQITQMQDFKKGLLQQMFV